MCVKGVLVQNQVGLHARPVTFFIQKANGFKSSIWVGKEERCVNAKNLLGVLSPGIVGGTDIRTIVDGSDEQDAVDSLAALVKPGFAEQEPAFWYELLSTGGDPGFHWERLRPAIFRQFKASLWRCLFVMPGLDPRSE